MLTILNIFIEGFKSKFDFDAQFSRIVTIFELELPCKPATLIWGNDEIREI